MASSRIINTNFWRDNYIIELDPSEKLLFIYFLSNPNTSLAGVYEINLRTVAFETGFDVDKVRTILARFCADGKMWYRDGWLVLKNFIKHQRLNPSIKAGIEKAIGELPDWLQKEIKTVRVDGQLSLLIGQSGDRLGTDSPQRKLKEAKLIKAKLKEAKGREGNQTFAMFDFWKQVVGVEQKRNNRLNLESCQSLLEEYGEEGLKKLILLVDLAHSDAAAGEAHLISDFYQLSYLKDKLLIWAKAKHLKQTEQIVRIG